MLACVLLLAVAPSLAQECDLPASTSALIGDLVASAQTGFDVTAQEQANTLVAAGRGLVDRVPYYSQYANTINPGGSCQNTSIAMVLRTYGVNVTPDAISARFGTSRGQSPEGVASIFNTYASEAGISQRIRSHRDGSIQGMKALLDQGKPVIVHGYFTGYGHVVVVTGYDANGYWVNDPAGMWSGRFKGGYQGSTNGKAVYYSRSSFEKAVGTWDGSTTAPLWYGEVTTSRP